MDSGKGPRWPIKFSWFQKTRPPPGFGKGQNPSEYRPENLENNLTKSPPHPKLGMRKPGNPMFPENGWRSKMQIQTSKTCSL